MFNLKDFTVADFVELYPCDYHWIKKLQWQDRSGTVQKVGRKLLTVKLASSGKLIKVHPANVITLNGFYA